MHYILSLLLILLPFCAQAGSYTINGRPLEEFKDSDESSPYFSKAVMIGAPKGNNIGFLINIQNNNISVINAVPTSSQTPSDFNVKVKQKFERSEISKIQLIKPLDDSDSIPNSKIYYNKVLVKCSEDLKFVTEIFKCTEAFFEVPNDICIIAPENIPSVIRELYIEKLPGFDYLQINGEINFNNPSIFNTGGMLVIGGKVTIITNLGDGDEPAISQEPNFSRTISSALKLIVTLKNGLVMLKYSNGAITLMGRNIYANGAMNLRDSNIDLHYAAGKVQFFGLNLHGNENTAELLEKLNKFSPIISFVET